MKHRNLIVFILLLLALFTVSCSSNTQENATTPPSSPTDTAPEATPISNESATVPPVQTGSAVSYEGITFSYDPTLAPAVTPATVPGLAGFPSDPDFVKYGTNIEFQFNDFVVTGNFHPPRLTVYDVADYTNLAPFAGEQVAALQSLLSSRPAAPEEIPYLPIVNAAQVVRTQVAYLDFANGSGVRFITYYAQDVSPLTNDAIFYTFQGLTSDGRYYISADFPVNASTLPATYDESAAAADYDAFAQNYLAYLDETIAQLDALTPTDFTPNLTLLDSLLQSLTVPADLGLAATAIPTQEFCASITHPALVTLHNGFNNSIGLANPSDGSICDVQLQDPNSTGYLGNMHTSTDALWYVLNDYTTSNSTIWRLNTDGTQTELPFTAITNDNYFFYDFVVSADGSKIAWSHSVPATDGTSTQLFMWVANSDGSDQVTLLDGVTVPTQSNILPIRFTPDGANLIYSVQPLGIGGSAFAFVGRYHAVYTIPVAGGAAALWYDCEAHGLFLCIGDVHPNGQSLAYVDVAGAVIQIIDPAGAVIASLPQTPGEYFAYPTFSPSGNRLAFFTATVADSDSFPTTKPGNLFVVEAPFTGTPALWLSGDEVFGVSSWIGEDQLLYNISSQTGSTFHTVDSNGAGLTVILDPHWFLTYWP